MNREFLINILFLIAVNLLIKPFYIFGIDRTVQNTVEAGDYGLYFAFFNFTFLFQIINDFGIQNYNNRNIAQHSYLLEKYFPNILILKALLAIIYFLVISIAATIAGYTLPYFPLLLMVGLNQVLNSIILFFRSNISGLALYRTDSVVSVIDKLLLIIICGILLWAPPFKDHFKIEWFVYAQTTTLFLTATIAFAIIYQKLPVLRFRFKPVFLWMIIKNSYPYALVIFLMTAYSRIDAVMIERLLENGRVEADIYASAYRLLDASNMIGFLFAGLLLPMFARLLKERLPVGPLLAFSFQFIWAAAAVLAIGTFMFQEEIMIALYKDADAYSGKILGYLILSFVAGSGAYIYGTLLTANGSLMKMNLLFTGGVVLNIGLNLLLLPKFKAEGAAIATLITQFVIFVGQIILAQKELALRFDWAQLLKIIGFSAVCGYVSWTIYQQATNNWLLYYLLSLAVGAL